MDSFSSSDVDLFQRWGFEGHAPLAPRAAAGIDAGVSFLSGLRSARRFPKNNSSPALTTPSNAPCSKLNPETNPVKLGNVEGRMAIAEEAKVTDPARKRRSRRSRRRSGLFCEETAAISWPFPPFDCHLGMATLFLSSEMGRNRLRWKSRKILEKNTPPPPLFFFHFHFSTSLAPKKPWTHPGYGFTGLFTWLGWVGRSPWQPPPVCFRCSPVAGGRPLPAPPWWSISILKASDHESSDGSNSGKTTPTQSPCHPVLPNESWARLEKSRNPKRNIYLLFLAKADEKKMISILRGSDHELSE